MTSSPGLSRETFRTGKQPAQRDYRSLDFSKYLMRLPEPPRAAGLRGGEGVAWSSFYNEIFRTCVPAAILNLQQAWEAHSGRTSEWDPSEALDVYARMANFNPEGLTPPPPGEKPSWSDSGQGRKDAYDFELKYNDFGVALLPGLKFWANPKDGKASVGRYGLFGYALAEPQAPEQLAAAVWLFGGALVGLRLPLSVAQTPPSDVWAVPSGGAVGPGAPGSWQNHCVAVVGYGPYGVVCVAWGEPQHLTWEFLKTYADEVYVPLPTADPSGQGDPAPVLAENVDFPWQLMAQDKATASQTFPPLRDDDFGGRMHP